jgi:hypothetical protein
MTMTEYDPIASWDELCPAGARRFYEGDGTRRASEPRCGRSSGSRSRRMIPGIGPAATK